MSLPDGIIANADDFGLRSSINRAILYCFEKEYINSTSLMTNTFFFDEAVEMFHNHPVIRNVGVHVNLSEGKPLTKFNQSKYLDKNGNWNNENILKKFQVLSSDAKSAFSKEIHAQINKAILNKIPIIHLDSHFHTHTLPCFYKLFLEAAKFHKLKIRLAQTYNEDNYIKFYYRKYINNAFRTSQKNYSDRFDDVTNFLTHSNLLDKNRTTEIMIHPDFNSAGLLIDHYDVESSRGKSSKSIEDWIRFISN
ncbi:MAG: ChbG/HpnK family deacetylase [Bacteroidia bacterium]